MLPNNQYNRLKGNRKASFDSDDEADFIADEQAQINFYNQMEQDDYYQGT